MHFHDRVEAEVVDCPRDLVFLSGWLSHQRGGGEYIDGSDGGIEGCPLVLRRPSEEVQRRGLFVLADVVRAIFGFCGGEDGAYPVSIVVVIKWCEECVPVNRAESGLSTVELRATILG